MFSLPAPWLDLPTTYLTERSDGVRQNERYNRNIVKSVLSSQKQKKWKLAAIAILMLKCLCGSQPALKI